MFEAVKKNLEERGYTVSCFATAAEAAEYLDGRINGTTVAFGGSVTLAEMGLYEKLATHNEVLWHQKPAEGKTGKEIRDAAREKLDTIEENTEKQKEAADAVDSFDDKTVNSSDIDKCAKVNKSLNSALNYGIDS